MDSGEDRGRMLKGCKCETSILKSLYALSDAAELILRNFLRELTRELKPLHGPTNRRHIFELSRFQHDCRYGISAIKHSACRHPLILEYFRELDLLHEWPSAVVNQTQGQALQSECFVPDLIALVRRLLRQTKRCKADIYRTLKCGMNEK